MVVPPGKNEAIGQEIVRGLLQIVEIPKHTSGQWENLLAKARLSALIEQVEKAVWDRGTRKELTNLTKDEVLAVLKHLLGSKCAMMVAKDYPDR